MGNSVVFLTEVGRHNCSCEGLIDWRTDDIYLVLWASTHVPQQVTRYGTVTLEGQELRVGTSRFLSQGSFLLYKTSMAVFFLFWGVWWAEYDKEPEFGAKCE